MWVHRDHEALVGCSPCKKVIQSQKTKKKDSRTETWGVQWWGKSYDAAQEKEKIPPKETVKERIDATSNGLESYVYDIRHQLEEDQFSSKLSLEDKRDLEDMIHDALDWIEDHPNAAKEDILEKQKDVESVINPMIRQMYSGGNGGTDDEDFDFGDDEL